MSDNPLGALSLRHWPERIIAAAFGFSGIAAAVAWWIDCELAKSAVREEIRYGHRHGLFDIRRCGDGD